MLSEEDLIIVYEDMVGESLLRSARNALLNELVSGRISSEDFCVSM